MPPRIGPNGAIVKPSSSTKSQRTVRPTASKVIDLTRDSTDETSGNASGEEPAKEEDSEDAPGRHGEGPNRGRGHQNSSAGTQGRTSLGAGQATLGRQKTNDHQRVARRAQEGIMEDSFIVTSLHHRPWGAGDDHATIGSFSTEKEAEDAAYKDFIQRCERYADGWESEWRRRPGDDTRQLCGYCEDGEKDSEKYTASIKRIQQKRQVTVQSRALSTAQPKPGLVKPRHVYVVKKEQWINVGKDDPRGFCDEVGELKAVEIHGIYVDLDAANDSTREIYNGIFEEIDGNAETVTDTLKNSMATILVTDYEKMMTWSISVEKKSLKQE